MGREWVATIFGKLVLGGGRWWHVESFSALCGGCSSIINLTFAWHFLRVAAILFASLRLAATFISFRYGNGSATQSRSQTYSVSCTHSYTHTHRTHTLLFDCSHVDFQLEFVEWVAYLYNSKVFLWHFYVVYRLALGLLTLWQSWATITTCFMRKLKKELSKVKLKIF